MREDGRRPSRSPAPSAGSPRRRPRPPRDRRAWPGGAPSRARGSPSGDGGFRTKAPRSQRGGTGLRPGSIVRPEPRFPGGNGRPRRRCRPASGAFSAPATADRTKMPLGAAQRREPAGALPGDQRLQGGAHGGGLLPDPRKLLGLPQEFIVDVQRRSHMHQYASYMHTGQPGKVESTRVVGSDLPHQASAYRTGATVAVASPGEGEDRLEVNRKVGESGLGRLEYLGWIDVVVLVDDAVAQARRGGDLFHVATCEVAFHREVFPVVLVPLEGQAQERVGCPGFFVEDQEALGDLLHEKRVGPLEGNRIDLPAGEDAREFLLHLQQPAQAHLPVLEPDRNVDVAVLPRISCREGAEQKDEGDSVPPCDGGNSVPDFCGDLHGPMVPIAGKEVKTRCCAIPFPFAAEKPQAVFEVPWKAGKPKAASDVDFHGMALVMNSLKADKRPFTLSLSGRGNFKYVFPVLSSLAIIVAGNP